MVVLSNMKFNSKSGEDDSLEIDDRILGDGSITHLIQTFESEIDSGGP